MGLLRQNSGKRISDLRDELHEELHAALREHRSQVQAALAKQEERILLDLCQVCADAANDSARAQALRDELHQSLATCWTQLREALAKQTATNAQTLRIGLEKARRELQNSLFEVFSQAFEPLAECRRRLDELRPPSDPSGDEAVGETSPTDSNDGSAVKESFVFCCDHPASDRPPVVKDKLLVEGWALSRAGIQRIEAFVDGRPKVAVSYGALRPDVEEDYRDYPDSAHSGFISSLAVEDLPDGQHTLVVRIIASDGNQTEVERPFLVDRSLATSNQLPNINAEYQEWMRQHLPNEADLVSSRADMTRLTYQPRISLVVPVYDTPADCLRAMLDSVYGQVYSNWELCLVDDASTSSHVREILTQAASADSRVKVTFLMRNLGIAGASNAAFAQATGEFIGLLDSDDLLSPLALLEVVRLLNREPETDLIYTDEDKINQDGTFRWDPFFKPDWSPDLLLSMNYICHFGVYRRSIVEDIGARDNGVFRPKFEGSQDYDLVLRFTERTDRVRHVPQILYSWRAVPGSGARDQLAKPRAVDAAGVALGEALKRRSVAGLIEQGIRPGYWRARYEIFERPQVTVVLLTGGRLEYLEPCLRSVLKCSTYGALRVLLVDNSQASDVADFYTTLSASHTNLEYVEYRARPFNYSAINNYAVSRVRTPYLVLLNDDTRVLTADWVEAMLEHAQRPEVGVVGPMLLFPDDTIQHAGVILGVYENTGHAFKRYPVNAMGYFGLPQVIRNCSAVTFACAMLRRSLYEELGGLDACHLGHAFNDVDMCLRIRERGYRVVYTPHAKLYHMESATKTAVAAPGEVEYMQRRWGHVILRDPFYNPNLTKQAENYSLNLETISENS
jgi:GT2 family glycosyltransferase